MMLKGFFANINMKAKNKVKGFQVVVELFTLFPAPMLMPPSSITSKSTKAHAAPILAKIGQKLRPGSPNLHTCTAPVVRSRTAP